MTDEIRNADEEIRPENLQDENAAVTDTEPTYTQPVYTEPVSTEPVSADSAAEENGYVRSETDTGYVSPVRPAESAANTAGMWTTPAYEPQQTTAQNYYSPSYHVPADERAAAPVKKEKKKRKHTFLKAVCIVLACVLLSSSAAYFAAGYVMDKRMAEFEAIRQSEQQQQTKVVIGAATTDDNNESVDVSSRNGESAAAAPTGDVMSAKEIYDMACKQVVGINTSVSGTNIFGQSTSAAVSGSGIIISEDGYILTNYHVVSYCVEYGYPMTVITYDGKSYDAQVIGYESSCDVAVIKIEAEGLSPAKIGDSDSISVGDKAYAVGNPLGELAYTMTSGIVSALDRVITTVSDTTGQSQSINMFQIDAAVNSGNSGGPVYNDRGELIGIVTAKYADEGVEGLGFAIPINDALNITTQLIEKGFVSGALLGVSVANVTDVYSNFAIEYYSYPSGAYVVSVVEGSCAEKGGIQAGDIITGLNGNAINSKAALIAGMKKCAPGDEGVITVYRTGATLETGEYIDLTVVFDETTGQNVTDEDTDENTDENTAPGQQFPGQQRPDQQVPDEGEQGGSGGYFDFPWPFGDWPFGGFGGGN